ncbi:MAG: hypothetical protein DVB31_17220 [Verrucomicrobia bacterium]|nr:MAG: hypothetical protein DVB31_17220 [Verrucomicrobiota bacterium]
MHLRIPLLAALVALAGCANDGSIDPSRIGKRRVERAAAFAELPADQQALVEKGQIKVGMVPDAIYIAWGPAAQVLQSGDASGETTTWLYQGTTTDDYLSWNYREVVRKDGTTYLDRYMDRDINLRTYISAELMFRGGVLASWKMLPKPPSQTIFAPVPTLR